MNTTAPDTQTSPDPQPETTAAPTSPSSAAPVGNRYRLAQQAKRLADGHTGARAALDDFEDVLRAPVVTTEDSYRRNPERPIPMAPPPTPMPGFPGSGVAPDVPVATPSTPPAPAPRLGVLGPLLVALLGVLLSVTTAQLARSTLRGAELWPPLYYVPGLLLLLALLAGGGALAAALAERAENRDGGRAEGAAGPRMAASPRFVAALLLYLVALAAVVLVAALWATAAVPYGGPEAALTVAVAAFVAVVTALALLSAQVRNGRGIAAARRARGGASPEGHGASAALVPEVVDLAAWRRESRVRRRERHRRRLRDRARAAVTAHAREWENVHHECQLHADAPDEDIARLRTALRRLDAERPGTADMDVTGNLATVVRCLARYHPDPLERRFDAANRVFRGETGADVTE